MHWSPDIALGVNKFRRKGLRTPKYRSDCGCIYVVQGYIHSTLLNTIRALDQRAQFEVIVMLSKRLKEPKTKSKSSYYWIAE